MFTLWQLERATGEQKLRWSCKIFIVDDCVAKSATPRQISEAVKRELSKIESMIKDLTPTSLKVEQHTVNDRAINDIRNHNLQLELGLTRTKLELLKLQQETTQPSAPKMAVATTTLQHLSQNQF